MGLSTSKMLIDEHPLTVQPSLAQALGINHAILLQQIHYWLKISERQKDQSKFKADRWWTYNTYKEWSEQMPWLKPRGIRKLVSDLREKRLIATKAFSADASDQTLWYTINYEGVEDLFGQLEEATEDDDHEEQTSEEEPLSETLRCQTMTPPPSQNDASNTETSTETVYEDSLRSSSAEVESSDRSDATVTESIDSPPPDLKTLRSKKQYGITQLMDRFNDAKAMGRSPTPPDEAYKRRTADIYSQYLKDHEVVELEPVLDYLVSCACGEGVGWLRGKKRWIPFVDAFEHCMSGTSPSEQASPDEGMHPQGEAATLAKEKPRQAVWYAAAAFGGCASVEEWQSRIDRGLTHTQLMEVDYAEAS